jgi:autotransporter translocation and assembly factor TamB
MTGSPVSPAPAPRRKPRRWLKVLLALVALVVLLVALLPTLVSWGLGRGMILGVIEGSINGKVGLSGLSVGWFSPLNVQGFTITDAAGNQAVNLNVNVSPGLLKLATNRSGPISVNISGSINGERREDGSINLADLFASDPSKTPTGPPPTPPTSKSPKPVTIPHFAVNVTGLTVQFTDAATKQAMAIDPLTGTISGGGALQPFIIDLQGKAVSNGVPGSVLIKVETDGLFDTLGQITFKDTSAKLDVQVSSLLLPLPLPDVQGMTELQSLAVNVASDDLTGKVVATIDAAAKAPGADVSTFKSTIAFDRLFTARGKLSPAGGSADIGMQMQSLPILAKDVHGSIQSLNFTIHSEDLAKSIDMTVDGRGQLEGHEPSSLTGRVSIDQLFAKNGDVDFAIDRVTGSINGKAVPTPPLQPFLAGVFR